jgi:hypothetical protein
MLTCLESGRSIEMPEIRTRPDGSKYPITPKKGAAAAVAAVIVGSAVALGAGATGGVAVGGAVDSAVGNAANRIVGQAVRTRVSRAKMSARSGRRVEAWVRMGLKQIKREVDEQFQCAIHSYGQVRQFFVNNPCESLNRELIAVIDDGGNTFLVSVSWVEMPGNGQAVELRKLADTYGTGNVSPIASNVLGLADVRYTGEFYDSRIDAELVVIAESAVLTGQPDPDMLEGAAQVAVQLPAP